MRVISNQIPPNVANMYVADQGPLNPNNYYGQSNPGNNQNANFRNEFIRPERYVPRIYPNATTFYPIKPSSGGKA